MSEPSSSGVPDEKEPGKDDVKKDDDDEELDALLDDALEGFDKPVQSTKPKEDPKPAEASSADVVWSEEFLQQASAEFEKNIRLMMAETGGAAGDDTGFAENLLKVSQEAAAKVFESHPEQGASFAETLKYLAEGTESLQAEPDEATLAKMLEKMAFGADGDASGDMGLGGLGEILPAMQGMLQSLLSKDLLYPSIKDIVNKYPDWLADNRSKLPAEQYDKYNRQFSIMQQVCTEFENEKDTDDGPTKNNRFEKILSLMQQMQECGHPPKELAGEADFMPNPFGDLGQAAGGPGMENCVIM